MGRVGPPVPPSIQRGSSNRLTLTNGRLHGCTVEGRSRSYLTHPEAPAATLKSSGGDDPPSIRGVGNPWACRARLVGAVGSCRF